MEIDFPSIKPKENLLIFLKNLLSALGCLSPQGDTDQGDTVLKVLSTDIFSLF